MSLGVIKRSLIIKLSCIFVFCIFVVSGCGGSYNRSSLRVTYKHHSDFRLGDDGGEIQLTVIDRRFLTHAIGIAGRGGFSMREKSAEPVGFLVKNAVAKLLTDAGFKIVPVAKNELTVAIHRFWIEWPAGVGVRVDAEVDLAATLKSSSETLWSRRENGRSESYGHAAGLVDLRLREDLLSDAFTSAIGNLFSEEQCRNISAVIHSDDDDAIKNMTGDRASSILCDLSELENDINVPTVSLAVIDFAVDDGVSTGVGRGLADVCRATIENVPSFVLLDRENMVSILGNQDFESAIQCDETKCIVVYGRKLRTQKMLHGRVNRVGEKNVLTLSLTDVSSARIDSLVTHIVDGGLDEVLDSVESVSCELIKKSLKREFKAKTYRHE